MDIQTPSAVLDPVFDGYLESPEGEMRAAETTKAQIGRPEWWYLEELLERDWTPPQGGDTYLLVRLVISLEPPRNQTVEEAELSAILVCAGSSTQPVAYDVFPRDVREQSDTDLKLALSPKLKLEKIEASIGSAETTIHVPKVEPVITTRGIGASDPVWHFRKHSRHPIVGSRFVYLVVARPRGTSEMDIAVGLTAVVRAGRFGFLRLGVPKKPGAQLRHTIR